jgi:hypothetical protein
MRDSFKHMFKVSIMICAVIYELVTNVFHSCQLLTFQRVIASPFNKRFKMHVTLNVHMQ